jgi:hypothetical protein
LADGRSRTFTERQGSQSRLQFVAALRKIPTDATSPIVGAVVLEYTQVVPAEAPRLAAIGMTS